MPQLNPEFFLSQIFWLVVTFSFLLIFLWRISIPRISLVLEKREIKINNDIEEAKKLQTEAEEIQNQIDKKLQDSREQRDILVKKSMLSLQNKSSTELLKVDNELNKIIQESATMIEKNKIEALEQINDQIHNITKLILSKLSNINVNEKEIEKAVADTKLKVTH